MDPPVARLVTHDPSGAIESAIRRIVNLRLKGRLLIVSGVAPFERRSELEGMTSAYGLILSVGRFARTLLEPLLNFAGILTTAEMFQKEMLEGLPPVDRALLNDPVIEARLLENTRENLRQRGYCILPEVSMLSRDWGFSLDEIETPTEIWHGELDTIVPPSMARKMAAAIPGCRAHYLPGSGHCLLFHCWRQILSAAIADKETSKRKQRRIENA